MKKPKQIIGRSDVVDLPELDLFDVEAKTDTGAYTSAIHCSEIEQFAEDGVKKLRFVIPTSKKHGLKRKEFTVENFSRRRIKNSFGQSEKRYVIKTKIRIFNRSFITEFSLSDRKKMKFPVLLGRKLLNKRFIVDVSLINVSFQQKQELKK